MDTSYKKTDDEWKKILTPEQYYVLRQKGTERAGTGEYNNHTEKGFYTTDDINDIFDIPFLF